MNKIALMIVVLAIALACMYDAERGPVKVPNEELYTNGNLEFSGNLGKQ